MGKGHRLRLGPPLGVLTPISKAHQESINTGGRGQRVWHRTHSDTLTVCIHTHCPHTCYCLRKYPSAHTLCNMPVGVQVCRCVCPSQCASVSYGVRLGNRLGVSRGVRPGSPPAELCVCVCVGSLTITSRTRCQAEVNKMDGVDSYYEFIAPPESIEDKYIHRNYEAGDQNEHLTFYNTLSLFLSALLPFFVATV